MTTAQIINRKRGARELVAAGVIGAEWIGRNLYAVKADGSRIHVDQLWQRQGYVLHAIAGPPVR